MEKILKNKRLLLGLGVVGLISSVMGIRLNTRTNYWKEYISIFNMTDMPILYILFACSIALIVFQLKLDKTGAGKVLLAVPIAIAVVAVLVLLVVLALIILFAGYDSSSG